MKELTAPELVKQWRKIVNDHVMVGRDSHLIKEFLLRATPVQVLLGMYQYKNNNTITIPQFLRQADTWLELDESWAEVELAIEITGHPPLDYYVYIENFDEERADYFTQGLAARVRLREWSERVLSV